VNGPGLAEKLVEIHHTLDDAHIHHAFGGAIALAYCTGEPRGTVDIDLNVFVAPTEVQRVFDHLPVGIEVNASDLSTVARDGQVRLFWDHTPVDLFFDYHPFHADVARRVYEVPFADISIPVVSCEDLVVFKAFFARTKDWADIEAIMAASSTDLAAASAMVADLLGTGHPNYLRLLDTLKRPPPDATSVPRLP
jgi:hypothetical protein